MRATFVKSFVESLHLSSSAHTDIEAIEYTPPKEGHARIAATQREKLHATCATRREQSARELATSPRGRRMAPTQLPSVSARHAPMHQRRMPEAWQRAPLLKPGSLSRTRRGRRALAPAR